jgi:hypothetical protein
MSVVDLKRQISTEWAGQPAAELCLRIVDYLTERSSQQLRMLTFQTLAKAAQRAEVDSDVLTAIQILTSTKLAILDSKAMFVDDDSEEHELTDDEFAEAMRTGEFVHPETGELVPDYARHVFPFFVPTAEFLAEKADD